MGVLTNITATAMVIDGCSFFYDGWDARLEKAGVTALQMTIPWPGDDSRMAVKRYGEFLKKIEGDDRVVMVDSAAGIESCYQNKQVGFILGCQDGSILENDLHLVAAFHSLGVRVLQLTYNKRNLIGDGCLEPANAGLSMFGRKMIEEMNHLGMVVDLSHVGEKSSLEAMEISSQPCIFSHSNPKKRVDNPRNITDEQIRCCAEKNGVIGLSPWPPISWMGNEAPPTRDDFIGHLEYVVDLVGIHHVSIGTDSEATPGAYPAHLSKSLGVDYPESQEAYRRAFPDKKKTVGFESMEKIPDLADSLLERGWKEEDLKKVLGENLFRVYQEVWGG